jgi:hypothetical protein
MNSAVARAQDPGGQRRRGTRCRRTAASAGRVSSTAGVCSQRKNWKKYGRSSVVGEMSSADRAYTAARSDEPVSSRAARDRPASGGPRRMTDPGGIVGAMTTS